MISAFDLFKIGIGPSSSHTVGPMRAGYAFAASLGAAGLAVRVARVEIRLYGSLAWTGRGHGSDKAVILGLAGQMPDTIDPDEADDIVARLASDKELTLPGGRTISFDPERDVVLDYEGATPVHPNTLMFSAFNDGDDLLFRETWYSVGGGFVIRDGDPIAVAGEDVRLPFPYRSGAELLGMGLSSGKTIAEMVLANECARRPREVVLDHLDRIAATMFACIDRGMGAEGELPGGLKVKRRAKALAGQIEADRARNIQPPHAVMDHVSLYAIAVNEENASGGRVVTAPTNGAAGVVPAVLRYYRDHCPEARGEMLRTFLLTATAVGGLFKMNASISGAEVGCQGEVGVACSMASAGLAAALGGSNAQIENAAEIGMEHHLGMTCDPIGGLVQIPCIERNAFGAIKAINAASLALRGDGTHKVSLDSVIRTMRETGRDMGSKYKETSQGGLAVNVPEC